jgi:hypothetical protein
MPPEGRIRIVHIITLLELGGAQQNTLHTVKALDRSRFDAVLIAGRGGYLDEEASSIPDARVVLLEELVRPIHPWKDLRALIRLKNRMPLSIISTACHIPGSREAPLYG